MGLWWHLWLLNNAGNWFSSNCHAQVVDGKHTAALEQVGKIEHFDLTKLRAIANDLVGSSKQNVLKFMKCASTAFSLSHACVVVCCPQLVLPCSGE